jgi:hypothetical protein
MKDIVLILIIAVIMIVAGIIIVAFIPEAKGFYEDQVKLCSFLNDCFVVDLDDFFTKKQMDTIDKSFNNIQKMKNISQSDSFACFLNDSMDRQLYCFQGHD